MPPRPRAHSQHCTKQQRADQHDPHAQPAAPAPAPAPVLAAHDAEEQPDGDREQRADERGQEQAGAEVDARGRVVAFLAVAGAVFEVGFL